MHGGAVLLIFNTQPIKNLRGNFFDNMSIDEKSEARFEKHQLVDELKVKMAANLTLLLPSMDPLSKNCPSDF